MSRAYSSTPVPELTDAELRDILLTCDGRGREVKERALEVLLERLQAETWAAALRNTPY